MKKNKIVFLFSGQGSQYIGMGQRLFENNKIFKTSLEQSEKIVQKQLGRSLINELYFTDQKRFDDVLITHPAIVAIEIAMYKVVQQIGINADYVSGNSLGEFSAGVVSGIWNEETAIEASIEQAKSIVRNNINGGMIAVINQNKIDLEQDYRNHNLFLASDNFLGHFTLSGAVESLDAFQLQLSQRNIQFLRLPVSIPFHSPLILEGFEGFNHFMNMTPLNQPKSTFISGIENKELDSISQKYFKKVVSLYTNYPKVVQYIESKGPCFYIDLGPSGTSSTFVKYNLGPLSKSTVFQIMTPFKRELEQLDKLKEIIGTI